MTKRIAATMSFDNNSGASVAAFIQEDLHQQANNLRQEHVKFLQSPALHFPRFENYS
jgi:hypothetical protein